MAVSLYSLLNRTTPSHTTNSTWDEVAALYGFGQQNPDGSYLSKDGDYFWTDPSRIPDIPYNGVNYGPGAAYGSPGVQYNPGTRAGYTDQEWAQMTAGNAAQQATVDNSLSSKLANQYVNSWYGNVIGKAGDQQGIDYWTQQLLNTNNTGARAMEAPEYEAVFNEFLKAAQGVDPSIQWGQSPWAALRTHTIDPSLPGYAPLNTTQYTNVIGDGTNLGKPPATNAPSPGSPRRRHEQRQQQQQQNNLAGNFNPYMFLRGVIPGQRWGSGLSNNSYMNPFVNTPYAFMSQQQPQRRK